MSDSEPTPGPPSATLAAEAARASLPQGPAGSVPAHGVRDILRLTWPVVLSQLMAGGVSVIDMLMLGRLGTETLAAVGYATQFLFIVQACLIATGAACVAMMSRAIGADQPERARAAFATALTIGVTIATVMGGLGVAYPAALMSLLAVPQEVTDLAVPYFRLTLASSSLLAIALIHEHAFRAAKDTVRPMLLVAVVSSAKVALNLVLIFGAFGLPALELRGAGLATIGAQTIGALLFITIGRRSSHGALRLGIADFRSVPSLLRETLRIMGPAVAERLVMTLAMLTFFRFLGAYGVAAVAAYNVGVRILSFTWIPGIGLSAAASTLVGQSLGAGDAEAARTATTRCAKLGLGVSVVLGIIFVSARMPLARIFTSDPAVLSQLGPFILMLGLGLPFLVGHFTLSGALRGAGDTVTPLLAATLGNWMFRVPMAFTFAIVLETDLFWIWTIMPFDHLARAIFLWVAFRRGTWSQRLGTGADASAEAR